jgi:TRAP transporter TAXI family solute receptor
MSMRKSIALSIVAFGLGGLICAGPASAASKKLLAMGATQSSSSHYAYFVAIAKIMNTKVPDLNVSVVETGASVDNINRINKGDLDLGMTTIHLQYQANLGLGAWKGKPVKDQYVLWVYQPAPQNFVIREDSGVKTVQDLNGKPFNAGMRGSATESTVESICEALGITPKYYRGGTDDTVSAIKDNRIVGYAKSGAGTSTLDASSLDIATFTPIRLIGFTDKDIATVTAKYPYLSPITVPRGVYKDSPAYKTFAMLIGVVAGKNISEELGYKIVKACMENFQDQVAAYPSIKSEKLPQLTLETCNVPLHPGAIRYYREIGMKIPENLIPK